jgi:hypothetical protein
MTTREAGVTNAPKDTTKVVSTRAQRARILAAKTTREVVGMNARSVGTGTWRALVVGLALVGVMLVQAPAASASGVPLSSQSVLDWNAAAVAAVRSAVVIDPPGTAPRPLYQTEGLVYTSYVQAAVYDAVTAISHRYTPYHRVGIDGRGASLEAAVATAAYDTLVFYLGDPSGALGGDYTSALAAVPAGQAKQLGIAVGQAAASGIETLRAGDGRDAPISTPYGQGPPAPGLWVFAPPPSAQSAQTPWLAFMQPFLLHRAGQFRAVRPPALSSAQYAADLNETEAYGSATSTLRTPDETAIAWFWNANAIEVLNQTLRTAATQHQMDLVDAARLLAMGNLVPTDAGIACFHSKYTYLRWRPITAIRNADTDHNAATSADPTWTPLGTTPNHPEYPSQHGCITSALAQVLASVAGSDTIDAVIPGAQNGSSALTTSQTFATVQDLDTQLVDARIWIGFHFRSSVIAGENLGTQVATWDLARAFHPRHDQQGQTR